MKRISTGSLSTALQFPSHSKVSAEKSTQLSINTLASKETQLTNRTITEKPAQFRFPYSLFAQCFPSTFQTFRQPKTYRKLQYHSLDKKENKQKQKIGLERNSLSLKDSFMSFGKEKVSIETGPATTTILANDRITTEIISTQDRSKCNVSNATKNTGRSSFMVSTRNTVDEKWQKYQISLNSKLFLSQDFKIHEISSPIPRNNIIENGKTSSKQVNVHYHQKINPKKRKFSTDDSIKFKENVETDQSQSTNNPLEISSILCQSIPLVNQHKRNTTLEFDQMKDSLIDKLNSFRKQQSFIESKRKSFIRSHQRILQDSPRFCNFQNDWNKPENSHENQQEFLDFGKNFSNQLAQQKKIKITTLKDCGKTIVSRYNKSCEHKSVLQESNIVFQASKMFEDQNEEQLNLPTFSDSQIMFDVQTMKNFENDKPYSSFIRENEQCKSCDVQQATSQKEKSDTKRLNRTFLRSSKSSSQKQIRCKENDQQQIRFPLDTFIEYRQY